MFTFPITMMSSDGSYIITHALKFDASSSDYLSRTPSSSGNRKTWTFSAWVKRSAITGGPSSGDGVHLFGTDRGSGFGDRISFGNGDTDDRLNVQFNDTGDGRLQTKTYFRDPTAWTHFVVAVDTEQGTAANRVKIYINGTLLTASDLDTASYPAEDYLTMMNHTAAQHVGSRGGSASQFMDGYMADVIMLDGTAVSDASSFGSYDSNGVWGPVDPSGLTFGTNGFHLDFKVAPGTGNGAGTDVSGNGNHFTDNSLTAAQKVTDTPTDSADDDIGNYCTWSPIDKDSNVSLSLGNTVAEQDSASSWKAVFATQAIPSTGKWVWETKLHGTDPFGGWLAVGVASHNVLPSAARSAAGTILFDYRDDGVNDLRIFNQTASEDDQASNITFNNGEAFQFLVDSDAEELMIYVNGSKQGSTVDISGLTQPYKIMAVIYSGGSADCTLVTNSANFENSIGVSGYKTLNTANLPAPTVKNPDNGFALITLEDGDTIEASLANARAGWGSFIDVFKREDTNNEDYDVRFSDDSGNSMHFNTNAAAGSEATLASGVNYSAWSWRVGATYGCYTAEISHSNGSATNQAHSLGSGAKTAVAKRSDSTGDWYVSHPNMSSANIRFNVQEATTSELVTVDGTNVTLNSSFATGTYRVIVWEQIEGFSAFTGYDHNGSTTDGPYVHLNGSASLVAWRNIDSSNSNDFFATFPSYTSNGTGNPTDIRYNWGNGEKGYSGITIGDVTANGYKMRPSAGSAFGKDADDPMLVWAWGIRPFGGSGVAQARAR